jgi:hypothetical protein
LRVISATCSRYEDGLGMVIAGKKDDKGLMTEWTNFVGALHGAAAAFLVDT